MVATRVEAAAHQPSERFSIMPVLNRKKKMCPEMKVIFLGDAGVGKTRLLSAIARSDAPKAEIRSKMAIVDGEVVKLQLWDTADQEKFGARMLPNSYYRRAQAAVLVYNAFDHASFYNVIHWAKHLQCAHRQDEPLAVVLVSVRGQKHPGCHEVSEMQGRGLADMLKAAFVEIQSPLDADVCLSGLTRQMSNATVWDADLRDAAARLHAIEASIKPTESSSETETDSESEPEGEVDASRAVVIDVPSHPRLSVPTPLVSKTRQRRDSKFFVAMELGLASPTTSMLLPTGRELSRLALLGSCALLFVTPVALLLQPELTSTRSILTGAWDCAVWSASFF